ncbi:putative transmembrane protein [Toxoplasma gondii TgCatPRC2]|uniref:Transmembrane protein n=4 Tax=Toxoplasma gondii TaxID=5811 RepID=A0A125YG28_TOXGM|nr:hypothetical protein TGME49_299120 [Toxoplasma gondii ME49]ESS30400.1 putative transmembrane protein [Toxoplasma gondii VEG]KFG35279.1 putative transmembrane protein [Toxoplasma gondii GAB2-2007-GAL-DOM2]KYK67261.1 putative transmembrane protein [Toxoplasma gondii TgCatPRC2]EPT31642.1 hypothetical protein TGME49_299120 [Toxoplasma gondii ME49]CEL72371.1 TPA: hypothetical protein BN1205_105130 [Toxoplasma gondii VEG]|eukprot:XP_002371780.1 hypothetical protein TGME49_299120 [Toxoplasma gondii ME49]
MRSREIRRRKGGGVGGAIPVSHRGRAGEKWKHQGEIKETSFARRLRGHPDNEEARGFERNGAFFRLHAPQGEEDKRWNSSTSASKRRHGEERLAERRRQAQIRFFLFLFWANAKVYFACFAQLWGPLGLCDTDLPSFEKSRVCSRSHTDRKRTLRVFEKTIFEGSLCINAKTFLLHWLERHRSRLFLCGSPRSPQPPSCSVSFLAYSYSPFFSSLIRFSDSFL